MTAAATQSRGPRVCPGEGAGWKLVASVVVVSIAWGVAFAAVLYAGLTALERRKGLRL